MIKTLRVYCEQCGNECESFRLYQSNVKPTLLDNFSDATRLFRKSKAELVSIIACCATCGTEKSILKQCNNPPADIVAKQLAETILAIADICKKGQLANSPAEIKNRISAICALNSISIHFCDMIYAIVESDISNEISLWAARTKEEVENAVNYYGFKDEDI